MNQPVPTLRHASAEVRRILVCVGLFSAVINLLMLVGPIYMLQVYDRVLASGSVPTLVYLTVAAGGLILAGALLEGARSRVLVRLAGRADGLFSEALFARLHETALAGGGDRAQPLRDVETVRGFVTGSGLFFFFDAPWVPLFLAFVFLLHPLLFAVALTGAAILFALAMATELATRRLLAEATGHAVAATDFAASALRNAESAEAMGMLPGLRRRWLEHHRAGLALQALASDRAGILTAVVKFVRPVLQVAILGVGAWLVLGHEITAGAMVAASIIMGRALAPVEGAIGTWRGFVAARAAFARVKALLSAPGRRTSALPLPAPAGTVTVEKLVAAAPGGTAAIIKGISFGLEAGEALGIVGPSAAGKSTLARLMVGVWTPANGHVRLDGVDIAAWNHLEVGPHIGYLPQEIELFDGTIAENIARFGDADADAVVAAARLAGVHDMILRLPAGYDTAIGRSGTVLSGGQRQRIGLARALYGNPAFVVLDEPNSNLDSIGEHALRQALTALKRRGTTIVVVAHRPSVLGAVDKVMVLRDGMIEQFGPREEVLATLAPVAQVAQAPAARQIDLRRA
jgi:PrtD family type I secretion system ABC transporter